MFAETAADLVAGSSNSPKEALELEVKWPFASDLRRPMDFTTRWPDISHENI